MPIQDYLWAVGHGIAQASMQNVETELYQFTRPRLVGIRSQPVDRFPIREMVQAGYETGHGRIDHIWQLALNVEALEYIIETKFALTNTVAVACTIYTRRHDLDDFARYNAYITYPQVGRDLTYLRQRVFRAAIKFTGLTAL